MANLDTGGHSFLFSITANLTNSLDSGVSSSASWSIDLLETTWSQGVGEDQISRAWEQEITLLSGNTLDLDVRGATGRDIGAGSAADPLGQALTIEEIALLAVHVESGEGTLDVNTTLPSNALPWIPQYAARTAWGGGIGIDGMRVWCEPSTVGLDTSITQRYVRFAAVNGDVTFKVYVFGRHDDDASSDSSQSSSSSSSSSVSTSSSPA